MRPPQEGPTFREVAWGPSSRLERVRSDQVEIIHDSNLVNDCLVSAEGWWTHTKTKGESHGCLPFAIFNAKEVALDDKIKITAPSTGQEVEVEGKEVTDDVRLAYATMRSLREAAMFVKELTESFKIPPSKIPIYYSGKRGFHITIDHSIFDMNPSQLNRGIVAFFANQMRYFYDLKTIDMEAYKKPRYMLRVVDSINTETGRYCVQLSLEEALKIDYPDLIQISSKPRGHVYAPKKDEFVGEDFRSMWSAVTGQFTRLDDLAKLKPLRPIRKDMPEPMCHAAIMLHGGRLVNKPIRMEAFVIARASYDKDVGVDKKISADTLMEWVLSPDTGGREVKLTSAIVRSVVDVIYSLDAYHFSCAFLRSIGNDPTVDVPICEEGEMCPGINVEDMQVANPPEVSLDRAVDPRWRGQRLNVNASLCGISSQPTTAPRTVVVKCPANIKICEKCPAGLYHGRWVKTVPAHDPFVLKAASIGREKHSEAVKEWLKIPKGCKSHEIMILNEYTCYDINLIPTLKTTAEILDKDIPFVNRIAVLVDPGTIAGLRLEASRDYVLTVYPNGGPIIPKIILQVVDAKPSEDRIDQFMMTKEIHESLKIFQPAQGQSPRDRWREIYEDLSQNCLHIYGREDAFFCCDLIYHSLTANFRFADDKIDRAYMEFLCIGDTGQGKTTLAKRLIAHYGVGLFASGETSRRTGLLYSLVQTKNAEWFINWGILPMNDRRLVFIDEFSGLKHEDREVLTSVRSSGIVEVSGAARGSAQARTRLIFLTNSPDSRYVNQHNFGCDVVSQVFRKLEDVRRIDIANTLAIGDVDRREMSRLQQLKERTEHKYTSALCNKLILWAWSRRADQVEFTPKAIEAIFAAVEYLSEKYVHDIPLLLAEDLTNKAARGSAAVAARFYSTRDGEVLIVTEEHVKTWVWLVDMIYSKKSFGFLTKSTIIKNSRLKTAENIGVVHEFIYNMFSVNGDRAAFCQNILGLTTFSKRELSEVFPGDEGYEGFFRLLKTSRMIERVGQYWIKTEAMNDLIKRLLDDTGWEESAAEDAQAEPAGSESAEVADLFEEGAGD